MFFMLNTTKSNIDIEKYISTKKSIIDTKLKQIFQEDKYSYPKELWDAIKYSLLDGGKRFRGILCIAAYESIEPENLSLMDECLIVASSIEIIHAMSLIHDDLPCMDNDDLRRGKPSCHKAFSESTAILAGDAMLTLPFHLIIEDCKNLSSLQKINIINILSKVTTFGLTPGQILDLSIIKQKSSLETLEKIYALKTANLIAASVTCGALVSKEFTSLKETPINHLMNFGIKAGIAFQIIDDILDITSDTKTLGKTSGKDEKIQKPTYPLLVGLTESKKIANSMIEEAKGELQNISLSQSILPSLADFILKRIN